MEESTSWRADLARPDRAEHRLDALRRDGAAPSLHPGNLGQADGTKFGKTESGTVWLDPDLSNPYASYRFRINADD